MRARGLWGAVVVVLAAVRVEVRARGLEHSAALDAGGRYVLKWGFNGTSITFEIEAETRGYVGFGLSPNGAMASADLVIGGVADGVPYLQDYFADSNRAVHKDPVQNYRLLYGRENHTHTVLGFSRDLETCDPNDRAITGSTMRVIWALHREDVGPSGTQYHGANRGRKSLRFLNPGTSTNIPPGTSIYDMRNVNVSKVNK
ncbi:DBH-like monooxygenase protein 1 homolog, partial [Hoplias malabaricus]|uniref:DBH-like monooxygenase protein 1 homolog n=1 Tax=Hoplias malabaricus TaxID=27720 RepID=UPI003461BF6A